MKYRILFLSLLLVLFSSCESDQALELDPNDSVTDDRIGGDRGGNGGGNNGTGGGNGTAPGLGVLTGSINLNALPNYANQAVPNYIEEDNTEGNDISNIEALLGRVLFYDTNLSSDRSVSCASCHIQEHAFGDLDQLSEGVNGRTGRHSMRLVNARFGREDNFFWDERARDLEEQTTMPIQDHAEMGFSGTNGDPDMEDLLDRLSAINYYQRLFLEAYGDMNITERRIQLSLAQFIRSIQSFDSKYDAGRAMVNNENQNFPNFTNMENMGKRLFMQNPQFNGPSGNRVGGGLGCNACHNAPEFDIRANSRNNGVINVAGQPGVLDLDVTRSPTLRNLFKPNGSLNGPMMHTGEFNSMEAVLNHYDDIVRAPGNNNLDQRLARGGGVNLNMTDQEKAAVIAFLRTLTGEDVYTDERWSNPFE